MRSYGGEQNVVWPGDNPKCEHEWDNELLIRRSNDGVTTDKQKSNVGSHGRDIPIPHSTCVRCGAWKGPFGLEPTPDMFVDHLVALFRELRRVLRDDGTLWLNLGDSYNGSGGSTTTTNFGKQYDGKTGSFTAQPRHYSGLKPKDLVGIPWRVAFALQADGWYLRNDIIWHKPSVMPESVTDRCTKAHEYIFLLSKNQRYFYDNEAIKEPLQQSTIERYKYGWDGVDDDGSNGARTGSAYKKMKQGMTTGEAMGGSGSRNKRTVWTVATKPYKGAHFATYPPALITPCILAGSSEVGNCPECGNPWKRVIQKPDMGERPVRSSNAKMETDEVHISNGWAGTPKSAGQAYQEWRNENPNVTLGWQPTCFCCRTCDENEIPHRERDMIHAVQESRTREGVAETMEQEALGRSKKESEDQRNAEQIRESVLPMQEGVSVSHEESQVLQPNMFGQVDVGERIGESGLAAGEEQVQVCQNQREDGLRTSACDGTAHREGTVVNGDDSSHKRRQKRQPDRESGDHQSLESHQDSREIHAITPYDPVPAVVLDPFAGSGTTLAVALQHGRHAVGFELNPEYIELAEKRIAEAVEEVTVKEIPPLDVQLNDLPLFQERN